MFQRFLNKWLPPRIKSSSDFIAFLERSAWLVAQKTVIGYCTVKTNLPVHELAKDKPFADAYDVSIRHAYAASLADIIEIALGYLRSVAPGRESELADRLAEVHEFLLTAQTAPTAEGWGSEIAATRARLRLAVVSAPLPIRELSMTSAQRIIATLPIHERLRSPDAPAIAASVQFMMVGRAHEFERIEIGAVANDLLSQAPA